MSTRKRKQKAASDNFVSGWEEIGAEYGVSGRTLRRAVQSGNRVLKSVIRDLNKGGKRRRPIALLSEIVASRAHAFPHV